MEKSTNQVFIHIFRYLKAHQQDVTLILAITAQATHDLVPPDAIEPIIRAIIDNFVTDAFASEVISAGINAIREICTRCPLAITDELLAYACTFKTHRDKGVMMAARSLIALYREVNPEMLPKRERGKVAAIAVQRGAAEGLAYGRQSVATGVAGAELLAAQEQQGVDENGIEGEENDGWEVASDEDESGSDGGGGEWINVPSDDEIHLPDADFISSRKELRRERKLARLGVRKQDAEEVEEEDEEEMDSDSDASQQSELEDDDAEESMESEGEQDEESTTVPPAAKQQHRAPNRAHER